MANNECINNMKTQPTLPLLPPKGRIETEAVLAKGKLFAKIPVFCKRQLEPLQKNAIFANVSNRIKEV